MNIPITMFHCGFGTLWYQSLSCSSLSLIHSVAAINLKRGSINMTFFLSSAVKYRVHAEHFALFTLMRSGLEAALCPVRPLLCSLLYSAHAASVL